MPDHSERYRAVFARIARPLTPEDGVPEVVVAEHEARLGIRLPESLRAYYLVAGRFDRFNLAHNRLLRPDQWERDGDKLIFFEENQCVVFWGIDASAEPAGDPAVYQGPNVRGEPIEWYAEAERCSDFLLVTLHYQAVCGAYEFIGMAEAPAEVAEAAVAGWDFVGRDQELRAYSRDGGVVCLLESDGAWQIQVGGRDEPAFEGIEDDLRRVGIEVDQL